jgi:hypothetical protein
VLLKLVRSAFKCENNIELLSTRFVLIYSPNVILANTIATLAIISAFWPKREACSSLAILLGSDGILPT